jgi:hypothetical protein
MSDDPLDALKAALERTTRDSLGIGRAGSTGSVEPGAPTPGCPCPGCTAKWVRLYEENRAAYHEERVRFARLLGVDADAYDPINDASRQGSGYGFSPMSGVMSAEKMRRLLLGSVTEIQVQGKIETGDPVFVPVKPAPAAPAQPKAKEESKMAMQAKSLVTQRIEADDEVEVVEGGKKIVLPKGMTFDEAREWLARRESEQNQPFAVLETIEAHPLDGAWALHKALAKKYGWTKMEKTPPATHVRQGASSDHGRC